MFEEIFDVKRGRNLLDMFLSPTDEDGMLKDIERLKPDQRTIINLLWKIKSLFFFCFIVGLR